jgi:hypothetical protein
VKTRDVDVEARSVEALDELSHLPLGAPGMKARKENRDRILWHQVHSALPCST